jgi:hypothetical protein
MAKLVELSTNYEYNYDNNALNPKENLSTIFSGDINRIYQHYDNLIKRDITISGGLQKLKNNLNTAVNVSGEGGDSRIDEILKSIDLHPIISHLVDGMFYGLAVFNYIMKDGRIVWQKIPMTMLHQTYNNNVEMLVIYDNLGNEIRIEDNPNFVIFKYGTDGDKFSELGLGKLISFNAGIKSFIIQNFVNGTHLFGNPTIIGKTTRCNNPDNVTDCLQQKARTLHDSLTSSGIGYEQVDIDGTGDNFEIITAPNIDMTKLKDITQYYDDKIINIITGYILGSSSSSGGTNGMAVTQKEDSDSRLIADLRIISTFLTKWLREAYKEDLVVELRAEKKKLSLNDFLESALKLKELGYQPKEEVLKQFCDFDIEKVKEPHPAIDTNGEVNG